MSNRTNILINDSGTDLSAEGYAALRLMDNQAATAALLEAESPAARFVTKFTSERFGRFGLPTLLAARGADWDIRMRRLDDADLERERRIFGAS